MEIVSPIIKFDEIDNIEYFTTEEYAKANDTFKMLDFKDFIGTDKQLASNVDAQF